MDYQKLTVEWVNNVSLSYKKLEEEYNKALEKIKELETELYFCYRNKKIED